jgi:hypothetical protein
MDDAAVAFALVADEPAVRRAAAALFPDVPHRILGRAALRPETPFRGSLFELLGASPQGALLGLVVPVRITGDGGEAAAEPAFVPVADHVNLALAGPLAGPWPADVPRSFPALTGVYHPCAIRALGEGRVYSPGVVAGVADAERLTPFEAGVVRDVGYRAVSDTLVPAAIIAAYYGLTLAACGISRANRCDEKRGVT